MKSHEMLLRLFAVLFLIGFLQVGWGFIVSPVIRMLIAIDAGEKVRDRTDRQQVREYLDRALTGSQKGHFVEGGFLIVLSGIAIRVLWQARHDNQRLQ